MATVVGQLVGGQVYRCNATGPTGGGAWNLLLECSFEPQRSQPPQWGAVMMIEIEMGDRRLVMAVGV